MLFMVRFTDKPDALPVRQKYLQEHFAWLDERKDIVLVPGSLRPDVDAKPIGACWIVEAASKADVEKLFLTDPFWVNGLRQSVEIFVWGKAFPERKTPV